MSQFSCKKQVGICWSHQVFLCREQTPKPVVVSWMGALSLRWRLSTGLQAYAMGCPIHNL